MRYTLDCEFNSYKGALISMALVALDGRSLYRGSTEPLQVDEWVWNNVTPVLYKAKVPFVLSTPAELASALEEFFKGDDNPHIIVDWPDDIKYFCDAIITGPGTMINIPKISFEVVRVDAYPSELTEAVQHNAWWDAVALWWELGEDPLGLRKL